MTCAQVLVFILFSLLAAQRAALLFTSQLFSLATKALVHRLNTRHKARAAPAQTGSSRMAMMSLIHFGTAGI